MSCPGQLAQLVEVSSGWAGASGLIPGQNAYKINQGTHEWVEQEIDVLSLFVSFSLKSMII